MTTKAAERRAVHGTGKAYWRRLGSEVRRDKWLYFLLIPGLIYFLLFKYLPMWGIIIGFEDYSPFLGPFNSPWKGLYWFERFFSTKKWMDYMGNTLILSFMSIVFTFPAPCCDKYSLPKYEDASIGTIDIMTSPDTIFWFLCQYFVSATAPSTGLVNR